VSQEATSIREYAIVRHALNECRGREPNVDIRDRVWLPVAGGWRWWASRDPCPATDVRHERSQESGRYTFCLSAQRSLLCPSLQPIRHHQPSSATVETDPRDSKRNRALLLDDARAGVKRTTRPCACLCCQAYNNRRIGRALGHFESYHRFGERRNMSVGPKSSFEASLLEKELSTKS
jgi:hypothetical protein